MSEANKGLVSEDVKSFVAKYAPLMHDLARAFNWGASWISDSDIAQEALLDAFDCPEQVRNGSQAKQEAWVRTVVRNTALSALRDQQRAKRDRTREQAFDADLLKCLVDRRPTPAALAEHAEQMARVRAALQRLPWLQSEAIRLRFIEEMRLTEIAARFAISTAAVSALLRRGMANLRRLIGPSEGR
jgi:RNA polymerase sigma-70 factor (ECF subfamily)